jgi:hypothetical protein
VYMVKGSPILFAAAAACSFANFAGSMVVWVVGGDPCGLSKKDYGRCPR